MKYFTARCEWGMSGSLRVENEIWHAISSSLHSIEIRRFRINFERMIGYDLSPRMLPHVTPPTIVVLAGKEAMSRF